MNEARPGWVNLEKAFEASRVGKASLGTADNLPIPGFMPSLNGPEDLQVTLGMDQIPDRMNGVVLHLHTAQKILRAARNLDRAALVHGGMRWSDLSRKVPVLFDPHSEIFYLKKPFLRKQISDYPEAPSEFFRTMARADIANHVNVWAEAVESGQYARFLTWMEGYQRDANAPCVVPLTSFVDGRTLSSLEMCLTTNSYASEFIQDVLDSPPVIYVALNYPFLRNIDMVNRLFQGLYDIMQSLVPYGIILRIRKLPEAEGDDRSPRLGNLRMLLELFGSLGAEFHVMTMLFNSGTYGLPAIDWGFDAFSERLNGSFGDPIDPDPETETRIPKEHQYSKVYHPTKKINLGHQDYLTVHQREGAYPTVPDANAPSTSEENPRTFRMTAKRYRIMARVEEVRKIIDGIYQENSRGLGEEFSRSQATNIAKVLRSPF